MENLLIVSVTVSAVVILMLLLSPILEKRYSAGWKYYVWLILSVRLLIPFRLELPDAPIKFSSQPTGTFVMRTDENAPIEYFTDNSYVQKGNESTDSADYAPVLTLSQLLFVIWCLGAAGVLIYHITAYFRFKRKIKPHMHKKEDNIYLCGCIASPMMIGFIRPMILLPDVDYTDEELEVIMKHEMTHWNRHDIWYKLLLTAVSGVHWFNPVIHIMVRRANRDIEYSCDDIVIKGMDSDYKKNYALTILKSMKGTK